MMEVEPERNLDHTSKQLQKKSGGAEEVAAAGGSAMASSVVPSAARSAACLRTTAEEATVGSSNRSHTHQLHHLHTQQVASTSDLQGEGTLLTSATH